MIVVTGAAGFIGSCLIGELNQKGLQEIIAVDEEERSDKKVNYSTKKIHQFINRDNFIEWLETNAASVDFVFHIGARTDTTEKSVAIFNELNLNDYGPNEYHKGRMASVIFHTFHQIKQKGEMRLFRSHNPNYKNGEQLRDFVYVKDVVNVCCFLMYEMPKSGIYNLGSGKARTFMDLASLTFTSLGLTPKIDFVDTPEDIRSTYQYFTEADMSKLVGVGYSSPFHTLEEGISDYVKNYLLEEVIF